MRTTSQVTGHVRSLLRTCCISCRGFELICVKVFVEGSNAGRLVVNGGPGQDTCDASPGVAVQNCE